MELEKGTRKTYSSQIDMQVEDKPFPVLEKSKIKEDQEDNEDFDYVDDTDYGYEDIEQEDSATKDSSIMVLEKMMRETYSSQIDMQVEDKPFPVQEKSKIKEDQEDHEDFDIDNGYEDIVQETTATKDSSIILDDKFDPKPSFKEESKSMFNNIDDLDTFNNLLKNIFK